MKRSYALAAATVVVVVYGLLASQLGWPPFSPSTVCSDHQQRFCHGGQCDIDITVQACSAEGITVPVPELHLCKRDGVRTINWKLPPGGTFKFRDDGIDFKNLPDSQDFDPATKQKGPFKYSWTDQLRNGGGRTFDYGIRLQDASGRHCDKDPRIVND